MRHKQYVTDWYIKVSFSGIILLLTTFTIVDYLLCCRERSIADLIKTPGDLRQGWKTIKKVVMSRNDTLISREIAYPVLP